MAGGILFGCSEDLTSSSEEIMKKKAAAAAIIGLISGICYADLLVSFNTFGNTGNETTEPAAFTANNLDASDLTLVGISPAANGNRFGGTSWGVGDTLTVTNDYISLTINPTAGYMFSITNIVVFLDRSGTGPSNFTFRASSDNFATDLFSPILRTTTGILGTTNTVTSLTDISSSLELRLYGYNAGATTGTAGIDIGSDTPNFLINGTIAVVPEPAAVSMLILGLIGARGLIHRRRKT